MKIVCLIALGIGLLALGPASANAESLKLALVITNQNYSGDLKLDNPHRDGDLVKGALDKLGFQVRRIKDANKDTLTQEVADYVGRLARAGAEGIGFFYYAGHGAAESKNGENYLIPVGAAISLDSQLPLLGVKLNDIVDSVSATPSLVNFVVFDACRDVPIRFASRSAMHGLSKMDGQQNVLIAFSTQPGNTATDEGIYASSLVEEIQKPGVEASQVFSAVARRVFKATDKKQRPWKSDQLIDEYYFIPPALEAAQKPVTAPVTDQGQKSGPVGASGEKTVEASLSNSSPANSPQEGFPPRQASTQVTELSPPQLKEADRLHAPRDNCDLLAGASQDLGLAYESIAFEQVDGAKAIPACEKAVSRYPSEQRFRFQLARAYLAVKNYEQAVALYQRLSEEYHEPSMVSLAHLYREGKGVSRNPAEAIRLYNKAAGLGFAVASASLGSMYEKGDGVPQNMAEAAHHYQVAAEKGVAFAALRLAALYEAGDGVPKDPDQSVKFYRLAAAKGDAQAAVRLGKVLEGGSGALANKGEAVQLYRQAAEAGNASAMTNLAVLFDKGDWIAPDRAQAARWMLVAIRKGDSQALQAAPYEARTIEFRRELQRRLKLAGVYKGAIDGMPSAAVKSAVARLAARSR